MTTALNPTGSTSFNRQASNSDRLEIQLLLCCSRTAVDSETVAKIEKLLQQAIDWRYLITSAFSHGVAPLLYYNLSSHGSNQVPEAVLHQLKDYFQATARHNLLYIRELLRLLNLFSGQGLTVVPFKGPTLAASVYDNLALRSFSDLDIWVAPRDVPLVKDLLVTEGYKICKDHGFECHLIHPVSDINIDLHQALAPDFFRCSIDFDEVKSRLQSSKLAGTEILQLSPEDMLLMLCVIWGRDCYEGRVCLRQLCDINELLQTYPAMNWSWVLQQAHLLRIERIVLLPLTLTRNLLGSALPNSVDSRLKADHRVNLLAEKINAQLWYLKETSDEVSGVAASSPQPVYKHSLLNLREHWLDGLPYFLHGILTPTEQEAALFLLPKRLSFLYYPLRLFRLTHKYALGALRRG